MTRAGLAWRVCGVHVGSLSLSLCVYVCMSDLRTCAARHPRRNHPSHTRGRVGTPPSILCQFFRPVSARATRRGLCHHPHTPQRTFCSLRLTHSLPQHGSPSFCRMRRLFCWLVCGVCVFLYMHCDRQSKCTKPANADCRGPKCFHVVMCYELQSR